MVISCLGLRPARKNCVQRYNFFLRYARKIKDFRSGRRFLCLGHLSVIARSVVTADAIFRLSPSDQFYPIQLCEWLLGLADYGGLF